MRWPLGLVVFALVARATAATIQAPIVNGVSTGDYPAVGALLAPNDPDTGRLVCSGTLIGCRTFLTAGHCVEGAGPSDFIVYFQHVGFVGVSAIAMHPNYDYPVGDVAVLTLTAPVTGVRPASIDGTGGQAAGSAGTIVGFGRSGGTSEDYGLKRKGRVNVAPCTDGISNTTSICWNFAPPIGPTGEDSNTCNGDSGGPLFTDDGSGDRVAGVTSGGSSANCLAVDDSYDARVATYAAFIDTTSDGDNGAGVCSSLPVVGTAGTSVTTFAGVLGGSATQATHSFTVGSPVDVLRVTMNAVDDGSDFDLFVRAGSPPTTTTYDCVANGSGQFAACEFTTPAAGPWYVLVDHFSGAGGYQVTATTLTSPCAVPGNDGAPCDDGDACTDGETCTGGQCTGGGSVNCDDGIACTADSCSPSAGCRHVVQHDACGGCAACDASTGCFVGPRPACLATAFAGTSILKLRKPPSPTADLLVWKWSKGAATTPADFGTPTTTSNYHLCLYDETGVTPSLLARADIPAGGMCGTKPCWQGNGDAFKYRNAARTPDGISKLLLKAGASGHAKVTLKGKGATLPALPMLPLALPARVQLQAEGGGCFEAVFGTTGAVRNDTATFVGHDE